MGAVKAITAAQLSLASNSVYSVSLDEAIEAMRVTSDEMSVKLKETSLSVSTTPRLFGVEINLGVMCRDWRYVLRFSLISLRY